MTADMLYHFPRCRFASTNSIEAQALHIHSEGKEVRKAAKSGNLEHLDEEVMDCMHSCETYLRMRQERNGLDIRALMHKVAEKNEKRGYYDAH